MNSQRSKYLDKKALNYANCLSTEIQGATINSKNI